jgi:hypothetical protein
MMKISMKALLGAGSVAVIAAISLVPAAHAQAQPDTMNAAPPAQPGAMNPAGQPNTMAPQQNEQNGMQQNAYLPQQPAAAEPQFRQTEARYPGPKLN